MTNIEIKLDTSPLHDAVLHGKIDEVKELIGAGADVNIRDKHGNTPLHMAALFCNSEITELLIAGGADVNAKDEGGRAPLHCVAAPFSLHLKTVEALIEKGADSNIQDDKRLHLLHSASKVIANLLINNGADVNAKSVADKTPLHLAAYSGQKEVVEVLMEAGADVNARDNEEETPLDKAKKCNKNGSHDEIIAFLKRLTTS